MKDVYYIEVTEEDDGQRLDNFLVKKLKGVPKSYIYRVIRKGEVRIDMKRAKPDTKLCSGQSIRIPPVRVSEAKNPFVSVGLADHLNNSIIYEDEQLLVINKPAGIAVHGGSGLSLGVIEALRKIRTDLTYLELVHRLDKETSGCLLLAKKRSMLRSIQALFESREVSKTYWALLENKWQGQTCISVNVALKKNILQSGARIVIVSESGKPSETKFKLLNNFHNTCLVEAMPKTGRTHQIRVHAVSVGHPIVGDLKYGCSKTETSDQSSGQRLFLHARAIKFNLNGKDYVFQAELDDIFKKMLKESS